MLRHEEEKWDRAKGHDEHIQKVSARCLIASKGHEGDKVSHQEKAQVILRVQGKEG